MSLAKERFYIPCLNGIRAIAVLFVIIAHSGYEFVPGGFGVTIFFFLSGYLITTLLRLESMKTGTISIREFYVRRAYRILPPMYATIFLLCLLIWLNVLTGTLFWKTILLTCLFFTNYLFMFGSHVPPPGIGTLWSLAVEEHFYLVFPVLYYLLSSNRVRRWRQAFSVAVACALVLLWRIYLIYYLHRPTGNMGRVYLYTDTRIDSILFGCLLAIGLNPLFDPIDTRVRRNAGKLALLGLTLLAFSLLYRNDLFRETYRYSLQGIGLLLVFFFIVLLPGKLQVRWLENPVLRYIGRRSYVIYLIQTAISFELLSRLHLHPAVTLVLTIGLSVLYAEVMNRLIEEPMRVLKKRAMRGSYHDKVVTPEDPASGTELEASGSS